MRWDPWQAAEDHDVEVAVVPCPVPGLYFPDDPVIAIDEAAPPAVQRSALAHELGHHVLRHVPARDPTATARQELRASRWAAARLITLDDLAAATRGARSWHEVAAALDVDMGTLGLRLRELSGAERTRVRRALAGTAM